MKTFRNFITEKLTLNKQTKLYDPLNNSLKILDQNINSLEDLREMLEDYFNTKDAIFSCGNILHNESVFKHNSNWGKVVGDHFDIKFFYRERRKTKDAKYKLRFGIYGKFILMQLLRYYKGTWENIKIHGDREKNKFHIGDNFLTFLNRIKKFTNDNDIYEGDIHLINLFQLDDETITEKLKLSNTARLVEV